MIIRYIFFIASSRHVKGIVKSGVMNIVSHKICPNVSIPFRFCPPMFYKILIVKNANTIEMTAAMNDAMKITTLFLDCFVRNLMDR